MTVFLEITGQKLAIWPNISSNWVTFWAAVRRWGSGIGSISSLNPLRGSAAVFLFQVNPSAKNGAKFWSKDKVYWRFCLKASKEVIVSCLVSDHCCSHSGNSSSYCVNYVEFFWNLLFQNYCQKTDNCHWPTFDPVESTRFIVYMDWFTTMEYINLKSSITAASTPIRKYNINDYLDNKRT